MRLVIETARNGYIIRDQNDDSLPEDVITVADEDRVDATFGLLGEVLELVGPIGSRYSERRIRIVIEPGDKWVLPEGVECSHERVASWDYGDETRWSCRCGVGFVPAKQDVADAD